MYSKRVCIEAYENWNVSRGSLIGAADSMNHDGDNKLDIVINSERYIENLDDSKAINPT